MKLLPYPENVSLIKEQHVCSHYNCNINKSLIILTLFPIWTLSWKELINHNCQKLYLLVSSSYPLLTGKGWKRIAGQVVTTKALFYPVQTRIAAPSLWASSVRLLLHLNSDSKPLRDTNSCQNTSNLDNSCGIKTNHRHKYGLGINYTPQKLNSTLNIKD